MRRKDYVKQERPPPDATTISAALRAIPPTRETLSMKASILMMYYGAFRQGEVVPQTVAEFETLRHLTRADVRMTPGQMDIVIKTAKNLQCYDQRWYATVFPAQDPNMCLLAAVNKVLVHSPTVSKSQPMFVFHGSLRPIPASYVRA